MTEAVQYRALSTEYREVTAVYNALPDTERTTAVALKLIQRLREISGQLLELDKAVVRINPRCMYGNYQGPDLNVTIFQ